MNEAILTAPAIGTRSSMRRRLLVRRRLCFLAVGLVLAIGLGLRLWIMTGRLGTIDSDEALTGLMARHLWNGEFRAFMWRFNYQGTISTYPVALSLKLFGDTQFALELPFLIMSAGITAVIWRVGTRFLTAAQAVIAALVFWTWPAVFVWIGVKGLIFYVPTMLLGMSMILCAQRAVEEKTKYVDWCAAGLFAGLAWWTSPNVSYFLAPVGVWLLVFHWRKLWPPRCLVAVPFAIVGALPWIWNDIVYGFDSLKVDPGLAHGSYVDHLKYFVTHAQPVALGLRGAFDGRWIGGSVSGGLGKVLYLLVLVGLAVGVVLGLRKKSVAAIGVLTTPFVFALVPFASTPETQWVGNARYFYWFTPFLALTIASLARRVAGTVALAGFVTITTAWGFTRLTAYDYRIGVSPPLDNVIEVLERNGRTTAFASFWISGRLTFESSERITAVATDIGPTGKELEDKVRTSKNPAYVFFAENDVFGSVEAFRKRAAEEGIAFEEIRVDGNFIVVLPEKTMIAPPAWDISSRP
jgi:Dolichyl-phosphate-mannose-protein mannosyltransferase